MLLGGTFFNGSQQDLRPLQERTLCQWFPASPLIVAREKRFAMDAANAHDGCDALAKQVMDRIDECFDVEGDRLFY